MIRYGIVLLAVLALGAAADGIEKTAALGDFAAALGEPDGARRSELLLRSVAENPYYSAAAIRRLDAEWRKKSPDPAVLEELIKIGAAHPAAFDVAEASALWSLRAGRPVREVAAALERTLDAPEAGPANDGERRAELERLYLNLLLRGGDYAAGERFIERTLPRVPAARRFRFQEQALHFYRMAAFRTTLTAPDSPRWKTLPERGFKAAYDRMLAQLRREEPGLTTAEAIRRVYLYGSHRIPAARELSRRLAARPDSKLMTNAVLTAIAIEAGDLEALDLAAKVYPLPLEQQALNRFQTACAGKNFDAAAKWLEQISSPRLKTAKAIELDMRKRDFVKVRERCLDQINRGLASRELVYPLLSAAEVLRDPALLKQALALAGETPDDPAVANALGYVCAVLNVELPTSEKLLNYALSREPDNAAYLDSMAWLLYRKGELKAARRLLERALTLVTPEIGAGVILHHKGEVEAADGERDAAVRSLKQALECSEDDDELDVKSVREQLKALESK